MIKFAPRSARFVSKTVLLSALCCLVGSQTWAQDLTDLELEQLMDMRIDSVYGASKHEQRVTQAPSSISVITAAEIRDFGHRTLIDVLRTVRGLYVSDDRNYTYLGIRGFHRPNDYNTRVLVLIDGHRINDNVYDSGTIGREGMIDVHLIDRIEVIRGPSSSIYGSSAFLGVINVVTKRASQLDGLELAADVGTLATHTSRMSYGTEFDNGAEWLFSATHFNSDGDDSLYYPEFDQRISEDARARDNGVARGLDAEEAAHVFSSFRYKGLAIAAFVSDRNKDVPTASFGTLFNDGRESTSDERRYLDVKYEHALSADTTLAARAFYDHAGYRGAYPYDASEDGDAIDAVVSRDRTVGEWLGSDWQLTHLIGSHRLMLGGEYRRSLREFQSAYDDVEPLEEYWSDDQRSDTFGLFAQGEVLLSNTLRLNAGLRFDHFSAASVDTVNPRVALIWSPDSRTAVKLLYGEAFRAPNAYESRYSEAQWTRPPLAAETIDTYELVYERYVGTHYRVSFSAYRYSIDGLISQAATDEGLPYFDNLDDASARGVEFEAEGKLESGALLRVSYAIQRAEDDTTGAELSSSPRQLAKLNASMPLFAGALSTGLELQYQSSVKTLIGPTADDFLVANFSLRAPDLFRGLSGSLSIYNLTDEQYGYSGAEDHLQSVLLQDGRTMRAGFSYRF